MASISNYDREPEVLPEVLKLPVSASGRRLPRRGGVRFHQVYLYIYVDVYKTIDVDVDVDEDVNKTIDVDVDVDVDVNKTIDVDVDVDANVNRDRDGKDVDLGPHTHLHTQAHTSIYVHAHTYICIYIYVHMCNVIASSLSFVNLLTHLHVSMRKEISIYVVYYKREYTYSSICV